MTVFTFNIGYQVNGLGGGIINNTPILWYDVSASEFAKEVRDQVSKLFEYATYNHVPPSSIVLYTNIQDEGHEWNFSIKMINVREYKKLYDEWLNKRKNPEECDASKA